MHSKVKRDLLDVETALIGATSGAFTNNLLALISAHMLSGRSTARIILTAVLSVSGC